MGEVQMGRSEVPTSVVKYSEGLSTKVSIIIRRYVAYTAVRLSHAVIFFWFHFVSLYVLCGSV